ncbi:MAG: hypothetical protein ACI4P4_08665 [Faecousia sp.]
MQEPISAEATLEEAIEQMVLDRINVHGARHSAAVENAYQEFDTAFSKLKSTFTPDQTQLFISCDNAISHVTGELMEFYYRSGFSDAVNIMNGGKKNAD